MAMMTLGKKLNTQISEYLFKEFLNIHTNFQDVDIYQEFANKINLPISLTFLTPETLFCVFTHKSFHHEMNKRFQHNERMEFLGDTVLELIVTEKLLRDYPLMSEGELSKFRSSLVNENSLSGLAEILNLGPNILLGKGEIKSSGHTKPSILSDTFEAILGGIYHSFGLEKAKEYFESCLVYLKQQTGRDFYSLKTVSNFDAKTKLQEIVMKKYKVNPKYDCVENTTEGTFNIQFKVNGKTIASDVYPSKKKGMQKLAAMILEKKLIDNDTETLC